jgi:peptidylprolyl isomerase
LPKAGQYELGSLAMANAGPNTNGSQFFIISGPDGMRLPPAYALFGKVVKGLDVVEAMQTVPTGAMDRPLTDVTIHSVTVNESD